MKNALVWGAGGGIGRAVVRQLAADGWATVAVTHAPAAVEGAALACEADVADAYAVQAAVRAAAMELGVVNLWVYCAGDITAARVGEMDESAWRRIVDANLTGVYLTLHHSLPLLADDAHIVIVGAVSERLRLPGLTAYAAAKAGLEAFADALAKEERTRKVLLVRPGAVATPFWERSPFRMPPNALPPEAVADAIVAAVREGKGGRFDL